MIKKIIIYFQIFAYFVMPFQLWQSAYSAELPPLPKIPNIIPLNFSSSLSINEVKTVHKIKIGIISDCPSKENSQLITNLEKELKSVLGLDYEISFPKGSVLVANGQISDIHSKTNSLLKNKNIDTIISIGYFASSYLSQQKNLHKSVICAINLETQEPNSLKNKAKVNFINTNFSIIKDTENFYNTIQFKNLTILTDSQFAKVYPNYLKQIEVSLKKHGVQTKFVNADTETNNLLNNIPKETDAIYILPININKEKMSEFISFVNDAKIPTYAYNGKDYIQSGVLFASNPYNNEKIAKQTAINLQKILAGETPVSLKSDINSEEKVIFNQETADKIGYLPDWKLRTEANVVNTDKEDEDSALTLSATIEQAVKANFDILAKAYDVKASKKDINLAYSDFLPHVGGSVDYLHVGKSLQNIDFMGSQIELFPADTLNLTGKVSQLIYSDKAFANISIRKKAYEVKQIEDKQLKLDIATSAAATYMNMLKVKNVIKLQRNNLELLKANLEQATVKKKIGSANPAEVYRWNAEIASSKKDVLETETQQDIAKTDLNRILSRPLNARISTKEIDISDPLLLSNDVKFLKYIENPYKFRTLKAYVIQKSINDSPEIKQMDKMIQIKERELLAAKRDFWTPEISAQSYLMGFTPKGGFSSNAIWFAGISAALPSFDGGGKIAVFQKYKEELEGLKLQRQSLASKISERAQVALYNLATAYPNIKLTNDASFNTHKALKIVLDNYKTGTISYYDVINTQNLALASDLLACNAKYEFISNLIQFQRSIGIVDPSMNGGDWKSWFDDLEKFSTEESAKLQTAKTENSSKASNNIISLKNKGEHNAK